MAIVCLLSIEAKESAFTITRGCASPGDTLTLECSVAIERLQGGGTVWRGTAFDCPSGDSEIVILYNRFVSRYCNNGTIVGWNLGIGSDNRTYTSRLNITVSPGIIGKNITCEYDNGTQSILAAGSIKMIKGIYTAIIVN